MGYKFELPYRKSIRLHGYDYSQSGFYFITINVYRHQCMFGKIENARMIFNDLGKIAQEYLIDIPNHFKHSAVNEFVVMPNHIHIILEILNNHNLGIGIERKNKFGFLIPDSTSIIVNQYKSAVTRWSNRNNHIGFKWQSLYYEHIIRDIMEHTRIIDYISDNPAKWGKDKFYKNYR
jgi:REP element-mobilizing transposase RayT